MFKKLFEFLFNNSFFFKFILNFNASNVGNSLKININKREVPIIVSISHNNENFNNLELSLYSLLNQTVCPDKIILWLDSTYELSDLPYEITRYTKNGLEIRFSENLNTYTKLINPIKENKNSIIVTAETNIYYPKNWLEKLYHSYISKPQDIHVNRVHRLALADNNILPFKMWKKYFKEERSGYDYFPDNAGGILFPPKCFVSEVFRNDLYNKFVPNSYNIWIWCMSVISGKKIRLVKSHIKKLTVLDYSEQFKKELKNNNIDDKISALMKYYSQNIISKLNKK